MAKYCAGQKTKMLWIIFAFFFFYLSLQCNTNRSLGQIFLRNYCSNNFVIWYKCFVWVQIDIWTSYFRIIFYSSKILHSPIPTPILDIKIMVTDLRTFMLKFTLKFLGPNYFQKLWWIWFMFGTRLDTGLKFYAIPFTPPIPDLKVKVTDLALLY